MQQHREDVDALSDVAAEDQVISAVIGLPRDRSEDMRRMLTAEDFFLPGNAALWSAAVEALADGNLGPATVAGRIVDQGLTSLFGDTRGGRQSTDRLVVERAMYGAVMSQSEASAAAARVAEKSAARRAFLAVDHARQVLLAGHDAEDVARDTVAQLRSIRTANALPTGYYYTADVYEMETGDTGQPVIPGLVNRDTRVVIVGFEGSGKSWLARQVAELAAQGAHPFGGPRFDPVRALIVDLENPLESVQATLNRIMPELRKKVPYDRTRVRLWHQPEGVDIRTAAGYADLTAVIRDHQPDLVCIGPAYHMSRKLPREDDEQFATSTLNVLSDLRVRFGFGLLLEHHAPHGSGGSNRELRPFGSSAWLRWPEIGIGLRPDGPQEDLNAAMKLERWRGDRVQNSWPKRIVRVAGTDGYRPWVDAELVDGLRSW